MKPDYARIKTLNYFLEHSNADEIDTQWFLRTLPRYFPKLQDKMINGQRVKWLEVGPGPGTKTLNIAKILTSRYNTRIDFCGVEPCRGWIDIYKKNALKSGVPNERVSLDVSETTWEAFSRKSNARFDIITFFHSVYGIEMRNGILRSFRNLPKLLEPDGKACIVVESQKCSLSVIRDYIFPWLFNGQAVSSETIEATLHNFNIPYVNDPRHQRQKFVVEDLFEIDHDGKNQLLSFIAQTEPGKYYRDISPKVRAKIQNYLMSKITTSRKGRYIDVADLFIWVG